MKQVLLLVWMSLCLGGQLVAQANYEQVLTRLNWLEGRWEQVNSLPCQSAFEYWEQTDSGFRGRGYTLQGGDTVFVETLAILQQQGTWYYVAEVSHNPEPTFFEIKESSGRSLECENPNHDFPKRIEYRLHNTGILEVHIMGDGRLELFTFRRVYGRDG